MSIIRKAKHKGNPFTIIENSTLEDDRLTWEAKGLLCHLLGKPDDWTVRISDLAKRSPDKKTRVHRAIKCLHDCGYVERIKLKTTAGTMAGTEYIVHESPVSPRCEKTECRENAMSEPPRPEKTEARENRDSQKPSVGKNAPLVNKDHIANNDSVPNKDSIPNNEAGVVGSQNSDDPWQNVFPKPMPKSETHKKQARVERNNEAMQEIGQCFNRRPSTRWSVYEAEALKRLWPLDPDEVQMVKEFYAAPEPANEKLFRRTGLDTLLNHWNGEVDKARAWHRQNRTTAPTAKRHRDDPNAKAHWDYTYNACRRCGETEDSARQQADEQVERYVRGDIGPISSRAKSA